MANINVKGGIIKMNTSLKTGLMMVVLSFLMPACTQAGVVKTKNGVMWSDRKSGTKIYLIGNEFNVTGLQIITDESLKVIYHTRINSQEDVIKELKPANTHGKGYYYDLEHTFTHTTIWMAIEIQRDGKRDEDLTKTFYGSLYETVSNDVYW